MEKVITHSDDVDDAYNDLACPSNGPLGQLHYIHHNNAALSLSEARDYVQYQKMPDHRDCTSSPLEYNRCSTIHQNLPYDTSIVASRTYNISPLSHHGKQFFRSIRHTNDGNP